MIVVEAMDLERLSVIGLIVDVDVMHGVGLRIPEGNRNTGLLLCARLFVLQAQTRNEDPYIMISMGSVACNRSCILIACLKFE